MLDGKLILRTIHKVFLKENVEGKMLSDQYFPSNNISREGLILKDLMIDISILLIIGSFRTLPYFTNGTLTFYCDIGICKITPIVI